MRRQRGLIGLMGLAALVGLAVTPRLAAASQSTGVTTEKSASILVFPKVIADGTRDTIIQITNTSNSIQYAHCFYVNGALTNPALPPGPNNPPLWTEIDFDMLLTKQQPTHWVVSTGRLDNPADSPCRVGGRLANCAPKTSGTAAADCCDAGYDPGRVPPVAPDFTGELKCINVDAMGFPVQGNAFKGEATIETLATGDVSKYNAIGLRGISDFNHSAEVLCLGGDACPGSAGGAEYDACPQTWLLDHPAVGAADPVVNEQDLCNGDCASSVTTTLTVVPCTENFETQAPQPVTLQFSITNEFEQTFSASTTFTCWASLNLEDINPVFQAENVGGDILQTRMRTVAGYPGGVLAVLEETHTASFGTGPGALVARAAQNAHAIGVCATADGLTKSGQGCSADSDCPGAFPLCRYFAADFITMPQLQ